MEIFTSDSTPLTLLRGYIALAKYSGTSENSSLDDYARDSVVTRYEVDKARLCLSTFEAS